MLGRTLGISALLVFAHLWLRSGSGPYAGPILISPESPCAWNLAWLAGYFGLHSLLASNFAKRFIGLPTQRHRLFYLAVALGASLALWLVWADMSESVGGWSLSAPLSLPFYFLQTIGVAGFVWTARHFDLAAFFGARPDGAAPPSDTPLVDRGPFALCRHPSYFFGILLLASPHMPPGRLLLSLAVLAYAMVGSRLEETKLLKQWGEPYRRYRQCTPWLFPTFSSLRKALQR